MRLSAIAHALPGLRVVNEDIIERVLRESAPNLAPGELKFLRAALETFFRKSGTRVRYHRAEGETALDVGLRAGREALRRARVEPESVDLLLYAGVARAWVEPAMANLFQSELGLSRATCFDVMDACASWLRALWTVQGLMASGACRRALVLNCECNTREYIGYGLSSLDDLERHFAGYTIGEAATATLLDAGERPGDFRFAFRTWGGKHDLCKIALPRASDFAPVPAGNAFEPMRFNARSAELLGFTVEAMIEHFRETPFLNAEPYDLLLGHSVAEPIPGLLARRLGLDCALLFETHGRFGNTVSATLPLGLCVAAEEGRLRRGMRVLLAMGSAGVSSAWARFTY